jgi:4-hydroxy-4-methyl-2-oxoglutarate aldolase
MQRSKVYLQVRRVDAAVCKAAQGISVSDLHEAVGGKAALAATMAPNMRPLLKGVRIAGPAVTALCAPGDNLMMHRALDLAREGDVLVVQAQESGAQWGDVAAYYAKKKKLAGVVVDGYIRDTDELARIGSAVWSTLIGPSTPTKFGHGLVNAPIVCGGVRVEPGDLVAADGDGVIVVPRLQAAAVVQRARQRTEREEEQRAQIDAGGRPWDLHGAAQGYAKLEVEEIDAPWRPEEEKK